jgi:hypothetical protein
MAYFTLKVTTPYNNDEIRVMHLSRENQRAVES